MTCLLPLDLCLVQPAQVCPTHPGSPAHRQLSSLGTLSLEHLWIKIIMSLNSLERKTASERTVNHLPKIAYAVTLARELQGVCLFLYLFLPSLPHQCLVESLTHDI